MCTVTDQEIKQDGAAVVAAIEVQRRDVVVGLGNQRLHARAGAVRAGAFIRREGPLEVVEHDEAHGHVVQRDSDAFDVAEWHQPCARVFVAIECLGKTVLAMEDIGDFLSNIVDQFAVAA